MPRSSITLKNGVSTTRNRPKVVCYHSVSDGWPNVLAVTHRSFGRQIAALRRRFRPLSADALFDGVRRGLHITFDDAFRDVLDVVPVLEESGFRATIFVVTSMADVGSSFAVPELARDAVEHPERLATMNWVELSALAERGFEIGSHTVTHPHLTTLGDAELESELRDSRARLEDELGRPCRLLAYPYGEHDARVQAAAARVGYAGRLRAAGRHRPVESLRAPCASTSTAAIRSPG